MVVKVSSLKHLTWSKIPSKFSVDLERRHPCNFRFRSALKRGVGMTTLEVWGSNVSGRKLGSQLSTTEIPVTHSLSSCCSRSLSWLEKNVCLHEGLKRNLYNIPSKQPIQQYFNYQNVCLNTETYSAPSLLERLKFPWGTLRAMNTVPLQPSFTQRAKVCQGLALLRFSGF